MSYLLLLLCIAPLWFGYFIGFQIWQKRHTQRDAYFARRLNQRRALKAAIKRQRPIVMPVANTLAKWMNTSSLPLFHYKGIAGPAAIASAETYAKAERYPVSNDDIFVATQMKCGTTWMQQLVFEILHKGQGDLGDNGYKHMYALSPWLETTASVPIERAPLVSPYRKRIIKTHLPTELCPYSEQAKYIYVTRHPVSCFASIKDFFELLTGPFAPTKIDLLSWYNSDNMFWCSWAKHVNGWWQWSEHKDNVLFIHFEYMKAQPENTVDQLAGFLGVSLTSDEKKKVLEKSSFRYMQEHEENFEMAAPNLFSAAAGEHHFMKSGASQRHEEIEAEDKEQIMAYVRKELKNASYPAARFYPDLGKPKSKNTDLESS